MRKQEHDGMNTKFHIEEECIRPLMQHDMINTKFGIEEECMLPCCPLFPGHSYQEVQVSLSNYASIKISPMKTRKRNHDHALVDIVAKDSNMGLILLEIILNCVIRVSWDLISLVGLALISIQSSNLIRH